jgi:hypothetical protein
MLTEKVRELSLDRPPRYATFPIPAVTNFTALSIPKKDDLLM